MSRCIWCSSETEDPGPLCRQCVDGFLLGTIDTTAGRCPNCGLQVVWPGPAFGGWSRLRYAVCPECQSPLHRTNRRYRGERRFVARPIRRRLRIVQSA